MGAVATGLGLAGVAGQTLGNVKALDTNADILEQEARQTEMNAAYDERQQRRLNKFAAGEANANVAASGLSLSSGSPLLMELDRAKQQEMEALNIRRGGAMEAQSKRFRSDVLQGQKTNAIFTGAAQGGSILSQYVGRKY